MFKLEMLPAGNGDCLWVAYGPTAHPYNLLIDGGVKETYTRELKPRLEARSENPVRFETLILTHIDGDHIQGALELIADVEAPAEIGDVWFNGWHHLPQDFYSAREAIEFTGHIRERDLSWNQQFAGQAVATDPAAKLPSVELPGGLRLTVLSPTTADLRKLKTGWDKALAKAGLLEGWQREFLAPDEEGDPSDSMNIDALAASPFRKDRSIPNGTSIALLAEWTDRSATTGRRVLLAGDAHAPVLERSLRQFARSTDQDHVRLNAFKVSHHGSGRNLSNELLSVIDCRNYLFSTDGEGHGHPDRKTIARILKNGRPCSGEKINLFFNYQSPSNQVWDDRQLKERYQYEVVYPSTGESGLEVTVG